jgi:hypothetical protein
VSKGLSGLIGRQKVSGGGNSQGETAGGPVLKLDATGKFSLWAPIVKVDAVRKTVTGHVLSANVVDLQDDFIRPEEIWKSLEGYMLDFQEVGVMHRELNENLRVVECYQAPVSFQLEGQLVQEGDWLMTVKCLDDDVWSAVVDGQLRGFSIGGRAKRVKMMKPEDVEYLDET